MFSTISTAAARFSQVRPLSFIGVPADSVSRGGGAELAPAALRELGLPDALGGGDGGDLPVRIRGEQRDPETGLLASADVLATTTAVRTAVLERIAVGERPFVAGGCCALLPGALAGARDALGEIGLVHLDGHADLYDGDTSTSGEAADMPISAALGLGPSAWVEVAGGPSVRGDRTVLLGYRDREESIRDGMRQPEELDSPPLLCPIEEMRDIGSAAAADWAAGKLGDDMPHWVHFDVDVLDQGVFPATAYLMPNGLDWNELGAALGTLLASPSLIGASLGCYDPSADIENQYGERLVETIGRAAGQRTMS
jgi:arginase